MRHTNIPVIERDYYNSRWQADVQSAAVYIGIILVILVTAAWHDWLLFRAGQLPLTPLQQLSYGLRAAALTASLAVFCWLIAHRRQPQKRSFEWCIFVWEALAVIMSCVSDVLRPCSYYLSLVVEIPVILSMYLVIPQYNRRLRLIPPVVFSVALALIYLLHKQPPSVFGFESLYLGLLFVNLIGIYFSDKMYRNDYQLFYLSHIDELTGLYNRRHLKVQLQEQWRRCLTQRKLLAVCIIDIDFFKLFNDHYGHQCGDATLRKVAAGLAKAVDKQNSLAARYGGEEFLLVLSADSLAQIEELAEDIPRCIEALKIQHSVSAVSDWVTVSVGVAAFIPARGQQPEDLIRLADLALYQAKAQGRNQAVLYRQPADGIKEGLNQRNDP